MCVVFVNGFLTLVDHCGPHKRTPSVGAGDLGHPRSFQEDSEASAGGLVALTKLSRAVRKHLKEFSLIFTCHQASIERNWLFNWVYTSVWLCLDFRLFGHVSKFGLFGLAPSGPLRN